MKKRRGVSSYQLKILAIVTMLLDHLTASGLVLSGSQLEYMIGRGIGRIAFPLFCFMLVEGYYYTKNRMTYLAKLLALAFLSEVPFDLLFMRTSFNMAYQNVFFTLSIGLFAIILLGEVEKRFQTTHRKLSGSKERGYQFLNIILQLTILVLMTSFAEVLRTDYSSNGVLLIIMIYFFEKFYKVFSDSVKKYGEQSVKNMLAAFATFLWFFFYDMKGGGINESFGIPVIFLIYFYNGKRGSYQLPAWFFYVFYPLHLSIIVLLRSYLEGR